MMIKPGNLGVIKVSKATTFLFVDALFSSPTSSKSLVCRSKVADLLLL